MRGAQVAAVQHAPMDECELRWPLVVFPRSPAARSGDWAAAVRGCAERYLPRMGSVLFRGFDVLDAPAFRCWVAAFGAPVVEPWGSSCLLRGACEAAGASVASGPGTVGSLHHAYSHTARWPAKLWLQCPAARGPEVLYLVDGRDVWQRLPEHVRRRFAERGLAYQYEVRSASPGPAENEQLMARLRAQGLSCEMNQRGGVEARQHGPVVLAHSLTRELTWFNQAHLFPSRSRVGSSAALRWRDAAGRSWSASVRHADGSAVDPSLLAAVQGAFEQAQLVVPWEPGDVLLLDNELTAHGWHPIAGQLEPETAMADVRHFAASARGDAAAAVAERR